MSVTSWLSQSAGSMSLTNRQLDFCLPSAAGRECPRGIAALSAGPKSRARQRLPQHHDLSLSQQKRKKQRGWQRTQSIANSHSRTPYVAAWGCSVTIPTLKASLLNGASWLAKVLVRIKHTISRLENFFSSFLSSTLNCIWALLLWVYLSAILLW